MQTITETEARRIIDAGLPPAEGDRMTAARNGSFGIPVVEFMMDLEQRTGRHMSSREMDAMTTEEAVVGWLTATASA